MTFMPPDGASVSDAYLRFAEDEIRDQSPLYRELSHGVASDPEIDPMQTRSGGRVAAKLAAE
jgi:hypothetical protein